MHWCHAFTPYSELLRRLSNSYKDLGGLLLLPSSARGGPNLRFTALPPKWFGEEVIRPGKNIHIMDSAGSPLMMSSNALLEIRVISSR